MPANKTISINPNLFKVGNKNSTQKKDRKKKPDISAVKPSALKKQFLQRIKDHSSKQQKKVVANVPDPSFSSDFQKGMHYLDSLKKSKKQRRKHNKSPVAVHLPPELTEVKLPQPPPSSPPPYGNLKGGNKPTFREWKSKTQKLPIEKTPRFKPVQERSPTPAPPPQEAKPQIQTPVEAKPKARKHNKTVRNILGKKDGKVSVLIKNNNTRRKVQEEQNELRRKPIGEVKEYLKKRYLLKVGSKAPNEVIRKIYEEAHLSGDITNKNTETLIHNYINEET